MFGPVLQGDHVTLRPADDSDPPRFVPWFADMEVTRYLGRRMAVALYYEVDILKKFGEAGDTVFHPTSTCSIGKVVDEELRVKGVASLRVIDASVMPAVPSGNINAAVIAVAEKGADLVKRSWG